MLSGKFQIDSIEFTSLANCFYVQCSSSTAENFHTLFRILEAIDYFFTKELNDALSIPEASSYFLKMFSCAFGVFGALQSCLSGDCVIKKMCLFPFISIIFIRTNSKCKEISDKCQQQLYAALHHAIESFKIVERIAVFALESNEVLLMAEYRKVLHGVDFNLTDTDYSKQRAKSYDNIISRLTTRISSTTGDHRTQSLVDSTFLATSRCFLSRKFDGIVRFFCALMLDSN